MKIATTALMMLMFIAVPCAPSYAAPKAAKAAAGTSKIEQKIEWKQHFDEAVSYHDKKEYHRGVEAAKKSLLAIEGKLDSHVLELASSLNILSMLYDKLGDKAKAEPLMELSLALRVAHLDPEDAELASALSAIGDSLTQPGNKEAAKQYRQHANAINDVIALKAKQGPFHADVAKSLEVLATRAAKTGLYGHVEPIQRQILDIKQKLYGQYHPEVATQLEKVAITLSNDENGALKLLKRALQIREHLLGPEDPSVGTTFNLMGGALSHNKARYPEALYYYKNAAEIRLSTNGDSDPLLATSLHNIGKIYQSMKEYDKAESVYRLAISTDEKGLGYYHAIVAYDALALGEFFKKSGKVPESVSYFRRAYETNMKLFGEDHPATFRSAVELAAAFRDLGAHKHADALSAKNIAIANLYYAPENLPETGKLHETMAALLRKYEREEDAKYQDYMAGMAAVNDRYRQMIEKPHSDLQEQSDMVMRKLVFEGKPLEKKKPRKPMSDPISGR